MHENEPIKKMVVTTNIFTGIHKPPTSLHNLLKNTLEINLMCLFNSCPF